MMRKYNLGPKIRQKLPATRVPTNQPTNQPRPLKLSFINFFALIFCPFEMRSIVFSPELDFIIIFFIV